MAIRKRPSGRVFPAKHFFSSRFEAIESIAKANNAIDRVLGSGVSGRARHFALQNVLLRAESLGSSEANLVAQHIKKRIQRISSAMREEKKAGQKALQAKGKRKIAEKSKALKGVRLDLKKAIDRVNFFIEEQDITKRHQAFSHLIKTTKASECPKVVDWLVKFGNFFEEALEFESNYSRYADYVDRAFRFYGTASALCDKGKLRENSIDIQIKIFSLIKKTGLS